jgi:hypothetical protein
LFGHPLALAELGTAPGRGSQTLRAVPNERFTMVNMNGAFTFNEPGA